ncbi:MAG: restriction endonuclease [Candidatus Altiarchaeales archaeon HGW-Altiarchaeales-1]|nr:MAG: restriction endonuclease [Candidatus Altiarchaeales archaeon HGW-Altiarchaeales-2]PKP58516.1 MAG: restriction endonuclease [Candidatus Altiarchaeales archaeon HGW-Altiarchaeales-1]
MANHFVRLLEESGQHKISKELPDKINILAHKIRAYKEGKNLTLFETCLIDSKKEIFLNSIRSKNPDSMNKYKRVCLSPIRYAGGKSLAVGYVSELLPDNIKRLISPFFGGGSVEISCNINLGVEIIGFDIFEILAKYWNVQIKYPDILYDKLKELKPTKENYNKVKEILKKHWLKEITLNDIDLATYYYFNHNLSYGPSFLGWTSDIYLNEKKYESMLNKVKNFKVKNINVSCADFEKVFNDYPNDFFYCDPPYYLGSDSKMFKGIYPQRNFPIHHNNFNHEKLRELLHNHKGGFILSYNDCPTIREGYKDYKMIFPSWQYTMGQGETRIGLNRKNNNCDNNIKKSHEIIIYSIPNE